MTWLSYDDCLEVRMENNRDLFCAVFCMTVVNNMHTPVNSSQICMSVKVLCLCVCLDLVFSGAFFEST